MWRPGSKLLHPFNPELGIGVVRAVDGRFLVVHFPGPDEEFTLAAEGGGLSQLIPLATLKPKYGVGELICGAPPPACTPPK